MTPMADDAATDGYCWATNASGSYSLAIRQIRLQGVRDGRFEPRADDQEEMDAASAGRQNASKKTGSTNP